jgi:hypothetical protein
MISPELLRRHTFFGGFCVPELISRRLRDTQVQRPSLAPRQHT